MSIDYSNTDLYPFENFEKASRTVLEYLQELLGFKVWMMTKTEGDKWRILHTADQGYGIEEGTVFRWKDTFCSRMVAGEGPRIVPSVDEIAVYAEAPIREEISIGSYVGMPIIMEDGSLFGTLCAIDPDQKPDTIKKYQPLIELFAKLLSTILTADINAVDRAKIADNARRAEEQLKEQRLRLENIIKGTNVGTWEWNVQTGETVFNDRWAQMIGYTLDEISPVSIQTWQRFAHPDDLEGSDEKLKRHFRGENKYYEHECRMRHKDGYWVWVYDRGKVFSWTEDGKPLMMFGTHQDITDRKQAEFALRESEEKFQHLSRTDELTGLLNRRGWRECIAVEESRAKRYGEQPSVIVLDLDDLKETNDNLGHSAGDELIRNAAACIIKTIRNVDRVARIGGDEFAILVIEAGEEQSKAILKRLREQLSGEGINASTGMAVRSEDRGLEGAFARADEQMYEMKKNKIKN